MKTSVIQSYKTENVPEWIDLCLQSVRAWATIFGYNYRFVGDEIFEKIPNWYIKNTNNRPQIITDLGRLLLIQEELAAGMDRVIWLDADVLIFNPTDLMIDDSLEYAFGREFWIQLGKSGRRLKVYRNIHNAISLFKRANPFLEFYIYSCKRIIWGASGNVPNQVVGTKFLTALHNIINFDLVESVGMASPLVLNDISEGSGLALDRLRAITKTPLTALNLCLSLVNAEIDGIETTEDLMMKVCERLIQKKTI